MEARLPRPAYRRYIGAMAFHLARGPAAATQLITILEEELAGARARLGEDPPGAGAVHEARVAVKRMRAVLRLFEEAVPARSRRIATRLRRAAHALSAMREADACLESLTALATRYRAILTPAIAGHVRRGLEHRRSTSREDASEALGEARGALEAATRLVPSLGASSRALRQGMARSYRRTRRAMLTLRLDGGDAEFHRWRIRLKDHYYHMRLLEKLDATPRRRARLLHVLGEALGDDHNLTVLQELLLTDPARYGPEREGAVVLGCIAREQRRLRAGALRLGERVFAAKGSRFAADLRGWWPERR